MAVAILVGFCLDRGRPILERRTLRIQPGRDRSRPANGKGWPARHPVAVGVGVGDGVGDGDRHVGGGLNVRAASVDSGDVSRTLIAAVVLLAGCEQLKSPERIRELENRVDKLSDEVAALKGGSGSARTPGERAGSGAAAGEGPGSAAGSGAAEPSAGSGSAGGSATEEVAAGSGSAAAAASAEPAAGSGSGATEAPHGVPLHRLSDHAALHRGRSVERDAARDEDSKAHLDEFARHHPHNARELQPLGGRKVE
ncbi:MAG TPA: hypothetical protein VHT91_01840 [Kofleriaceae bacterium]|nr:hypothetical protein [Kofleriaceae bacterium]